MKKINAFTLAEVLLTLAVIGIVAAITLPSLLVDTTEKAFDVQKRALHARLAQAIGMMSSLSGYGTYIPDSKDSDGNDVLGKDDAAETFLYEGLSKVYKMNNICNSDNLDKCGVPSSFTTMAGGTMNFPKKLSELNSTLINTEWGQASDKQTIDTKVAAFETVNGESIAVFYNPNCKNNQDTGNAGNQGGDTSKNPNNWWDWLFIQNKMCVNFVYDLNGLKGPNKVGRDIGFITALYAKNPEVVAPIPFESDVSGTMTQRKAVEACTNFADDSRLPNKHELSSMFYNRELIGMSTDGSAGLKAQGYWSSSVISSSHAWRQGFGTGSRDRNPRSLSLYVRCIRK